MKFYQGVLSNVPETKSQTDKRNDGRKAEFYSPPLSQKSAEQKFLNLCLAKDTLIVLTHHFSVETS